MRRNSAQANPITGKAAGHATSGNVPAGSDVTVSSVEKATKEIGVLL